MILNLPPEPDNPQAQTNNAASSLSTLAAGGAMAAVAVAAGARPGKR